MWRSDVRSQNIDIKISEVFSHNETINNKIISEIEKDLQANPNDLISLVFLLYDVPETALKRLTDFQRISKNAGCFTNLNLLQEWYRDSKSNSNWKHALLEALLICQLHSILRKLGFHIPSIKNKYEPDNIYAKTYISPMKKMMYKFCENMNSNNLIKMKKSLLTYKIDTTNYECCELILLELMCQKFITLGEFPHDKKIIGQKVKVNGIIKIIENMSEFRRIASEMKELQELLNDDSKVISPAIKKEQHEKQKTDNRCSVDYFDDIFEEINNMDVNNAGNDTFKSDTLKLRQNHRRTY